MHSCLVSHLGVRTSSSYEGIREDGTGDVKLETARNTMENRDRRQVSRWSQTEIY